MHRINLPDWAVERGRRMNYFTHIDPGRTALIAVDLQNAFTCEGEVFGNAHARDVIPNVNRLAKALREKGGHVIWTRQTTQSAPLGLDESDPFVRRAMQALTVGADGHRLNAATDVRESDVVLNKLRYSAFIQGSSDIDARLKALGVDTLVVAGTLTNVCCESSARDAYMLDYRVLFAADATAAVTDEEHNAALLNLCLNFADVRTTDALLALIAGA
jgi:nicotinamidase-related amidase